MPGTKLRRQKPPGYTLSDNLSTGMTFRLEVGMTVRDDIHADITEFLHNKCDIDPAKVSEATLLNGELDVDSLDLIAMAQLLQNKYDVSLDDERIASTRTIGDVLTFVEDKIRKRA